MLLCRTPHSGGYFVEHLPVYFDLRSYFKIILVFVIQMTSLFAFYIRWIQYSCELVNKSFVESYPNIYLIMLTVKYQHWKKGFVIGQSFRKNMEM